LIFLVLILFLVIVLVFTLRRFFVTVPALFAFAFLRSICVLVAFVCVIAGDARASVASPHACFQTINTHN
jgi:hypothetical protein